MMRTWGRVYAADGTYQWVAVTTDAAGSDENVWLTTLIQCIKLNLGESPFYANLGIPAQPTIMTQVYPDYYMSAIQQWFAPFFAALTISRERTFTPTYNVGVTFKNGTSITVPVAV